MPDLSALLAAPVPMQAHAAAALLALLLGPLALYRRRRDRLHRLAGRVWVTIMAAAAATGLFLPATILPLAGGFGPIHALSLVVFWSLGYAVLAIRRGDVAGHSATMRSLYWNGVGIAGLFTLLPERLMNRVLFPDCPEAGVAAVLAGSVALALRILRARGRARAGADARPKNPLPFTRSLR